MEGGGWRMASRGRDQRSARGHSTGSNIPAAAVFGDSFSWRETRGRRTPQSAQLARSVARRATYSSVASISPVPTTSSSRGWSEARACSSAACSLGASPISSTRSSLGEALSQEAVELPLLAAGEAVVGEQDDAVEAVAQHLADLHQVFVAPLEARVDHRSPRMRQVLERLGHGPHRRGIVRIIDDHGGIAEAENIEPAGQLPRIARERFQTVADFLQAEAQRPDGGRGGQDVIDLKRDPAAVRQGHVGQAGQRRLTAAFRQDHGPVLHQHRAAAGGQVFADQLHVFAGEVDDALVGVLGHRRHERVGRVEHCRSARRTTATTVP